mgnify:CR=1 FL=1
MKNTLLILGIVIVAALAMGLPYILRNTTEEPTSTPPQTPASTPGLTPPSPSPAPAAPQAPASVSISISGFKFSPQSVSVKKGTKVTWTNQDSAGHTVTGDNGGPNSSLLNQGGTYSYTFDAVGTYKYHCSPHPFMTGEVRVSE